MTTNTTEEQVILVRGSAEYKEYIRHQGGWLKIAVNRLESNLATAARPLLLFFLIFTTIKTGLDRMGLATPIWLDILMLALQVAGVEGAVPGLSRQKQELSAQNKTKEADEIGSTILSTRWLAFLTGAEIGLSTIAGKLPGVDWLAWILVGYSILLLLARLWLITKFLIAMAKIEQKGPKIISQAEYDRQQKAAEQEQIRMDNAAIQQALNAWKSQQPVPPALSAIQTMIDQSLADLSSRLEQAINLQREQQRLLGKVQEIENSVLAMPDSEAMIQAILAYLMPEFQAKFQAVDQAIFRQSVTITELQNQAKRLPEKASSGTIQAEGSGKISGTPLPEKRPASGNVQAKNQAEQKVIRLVPANASREEMIAEARRLQAVGLSTYEIGEKLGKSAKTVQSWLSSGKKIQAEEEDIQAAN